MVVFPNAKINLGLNITEKRADGFHNILSCFYPVNWTDVLEILPADKLQFQSSGIPIPGNPTENLVVKAWELLHADFNIDPVNIHLHKVIPIGAGLGGGSADGTFAIKALNDLFSLGLSTSQMQVYAKQLGSDCPFFVENKPVLVSGTGDVFEETSLSLKGKFLVLVYPNMHITTGEAYRSIKPKFPAHVPADILVKEMATWREFLSNDFETGLNSSYEVIGEIKQMLYESGATYASMSGSGSAIYGIFDKETKLSFDSSFSVWTGWLE
ncbi:4-(cytidine 5'-diphospho)-2-C-methyl-D-erythritol kinase [Flammeovirgaceae bacterium SG7u.132]|nr:4-(cytidine 5'-diphospho)-2-C-methyl-D-erythritol kinase [Flammeovirgaceae bacterium SG7u.132]